MKHLYGWLLCVGLLLATTPFAAAIEAQPCYTYRTLDIPNPVGEVSHTSLRGINRAGVILGHHGDAEGPDGQQLVEAYTVVRQKRSKLLVTHLPHMAGLHYVQPQAINTQRDIAGTVRHTASGKWLGYVRRHLTVPTVRLVEVPGAASTDVYGLNSKRDVVGAFHRADETTPEGFLGPEHGFWLYRGQYIQIDAPFAGVLSTTLTDINTHQDIIGTYFTEDGIHGLHIVDGISATLDVPGTVMTFLSGMNDHGDIVGTYVRAWWDPYSGPVDEAGHGFLYRAGEFYDITPNVGERDTSAVGISHTGEIVGNYTDAQGVQHGFVATPTACANTVAQR